MTNNGSWLKGRRYDRRSVIGGMGALAVGAGFMAACGGGDEEPADATAATGSSAATSAAGSGAAATGAAGTADAKRGGQLDLLFDRDVTHLDFQATIGAGTSTLTMAVMNTLLRLDPYTGVSGKFVLEGDLAESWEATEEKVTFKLRQGVKWQNLSPVDGRELVAGDVKYSYDRVRTEDPTYVWGSKLAAVGEIETPDDYTVVLNLTEPSAPLLYDLAEGRGMTVLPPELVEADGGLTDRWIGTGPFILEQFEPGSFQHLVRNPDYFKEGRPYLDSVRIRPIPDAGARLANFLAGDAAFHELSGAEEVGQIESSLGVTASSFPDLGSAHVVYAAGPQGPAEMQDIRVRQAIDAAIDRQQVVDLGMGEGTIGGPVMPLNYGVWSLDEAFVKETYKQDLAEAQRLLDAAGVSGLVIPLEYSQQDGNAQAIAPFMQQHLAEVGVTVELNPLEHSIYLQRQVDGVFMMQLVGAPTGPDPDTLLTPYMHTNGGKNWGRVSNEELDRRIEQQRTTLDEDERIELVHGIARDWKQYLHRTHVAYPVSYQAWQPNVLGTWVIQTGIGMTRALDGVSLT